jgi:N-methylhydantoinase B/oxoprolinase/acetone carboxylase alpha subunit
VGKLFLNEHRISKLEHAQNGGALIMKPGNRLIIHTPGGGGYGTASPGG